MIIETVEPNSEAERAGLLPGDHILTYNNQPLISPWSFLALQENTFDVESVTLRGERGGEGFEVTVRPGELGILTRPDLPPDALILHERGREVAGTGNYAEAARLWDEGATCAGDAALAAWFQRNAGDALRSLCQWSAAQERYEAAEAAEKVPDSAARTALWRAIGECRVNQWDNEGAAVWYERARGVDEKAGRFLWCVNDLDGLGNAAAAREDGGAATEYYRRALEIAQRYAPDSVFVAQSLAGLGRAARVNRKMSAAREYLTRAVEMQRRLSPRSRKFPNMLVTLGGVTQDMGDLTTAHDCWLEALRIFERDTPGHTDIAKMYHNLGNIALERGDLDLAQDYYSHAMTAFERINPDSLEIVNPLTGAGNVASARGDHNAAERYYRRALTVAERVRPESPSVAISLVNIGNAVIQRGDYGVAETFYVRALDIFVRETPGYVQEAVTLRCLGDVAYARSNFAEAEERYSRSLSILERVLPQSVYCAGCLEMRGLALLGRKLPQEALLYFKRAIDSIERQRTEIAAPEARALLLAQHAQKYANLTKCDLALGDLEAAFSVLERARARSFLELLAERNVDLTADAPPELLRQRDTLDQRRAGLYEELGGLTATDENETRIEKLHQALREAEREQQDLTAQLRAASPRYAALQYPQPLGLAEAQTELEQGTLLLSYFVGDDETFLFAVTKDSAQAYTLPFGREALAARVAAFRNALNPRRMDYDGDAMLSEARRLYDDLLRPAHAAIGEAKRLLLCLDGPLHILPFAALVTNEGETPRYLGAEKALHSILSVTIYAQTRRREAENPPRRPAPVAPNRTTAGNQPRRLLAFADPVYPPLPQRSRIGVSPERSTEETVGDETESDELAQLQMRGLRLTPLPHSREEALHLGRLFGDAATLKLRAEATKTAVLDEAPDADLLHFACHGWFDSRTPLRSGLALSQPEALGNQTPDSDNGLLQAWEIFEKLKLKADLVTLSACQTGLGQEIRGEGLVGLTRAFQYAGARSLVVSLFPVSDASTSLFMGAFYSALRAGKSKDEALQAGVQTLRSSDKWNHPYYWSAFLLIGDRN